MFKKTNNKTLQQWKVWFSQSKVLTVSADTDHAAAVIAVKKIMCENGLCLENSSVNVTVEITGGDANTANSDFGELITVILETGKSPYWDRRRLPR